EDVVIHEIHAGAHLEHVLPRRLEPGVGQVVPEADAALDEVLGAAVAADDVLAARDLEEALRQARVLGARIPPEPRVVDLGFVEPGAVEDVVAQLADRDVLPEIDRLLEGVEAGTAAGTEVADVALPAVAEAELGGRRRAHGVAELAEEERLPERRG